MADPWTTTLPGPAAAGADTHLQDHDALTSAVVELREAVGELTALAEGLAKRLDELELPSDGG